jgi:hypothetical protein
VQFIADAANEPLGIAVRSRGPGRKLDHVDAVGGEHDIEGVGDLASRSRIRKRERGDPFAQVHHEVTGGLGGPGRGWMSSHAEADSAMSTSS